MANLRATKRMMATCTVFIVDAKSPRLALAKKLIEKYTPKLGLTGWAFYLSEGSSQDLAGDDGMTVLARMHEALPGLRRASIVINNEIDVTPGLGLDCSHGGYAIRTFEEVIVHEMAHVVFAEAGSDAFWADNKAFQILEERLCDRIAQVATV